LSKVAVAAADPQAVLGRLINPGEIHFRFKLWPQPAGAIEPDLDHIGFARRHLADRGACHLYGVRSRGLVLANRRLATERLATDYPDPLVGSEEVGTR